MEFKGTKGEWTIRDERKIECDGKCIADTWDFHVTHEEVVANTKLIAAAPKLLKALQDIVNQLDNDHTSEYMDDLQDNGIKAIYNALK